MADENQLPATNEPCGCFDLPYTDLGRAREFGMDRNFAEVSVLTCGACGQLWLRYFYEAEAFSNSGRWYLGAITPAQLSALTPENARAVMEGLAWYFHGGSYSDGHTGKRRGPLLLNP